jgi:hypothetical protein
LRNIGGEEMIFVKKSIKSLKITFVDEKDKVISEYDADISHLGISPSIVEDFVKEIFNGKYFME